MTLRVLVLSGGGSKGAFEAGVIKALVDRGVRWDAIAGVSVGAINGAFLAQFPKERQPEAADKLGFFWSSVEGNGSIYKRWFPFGKIHALKKGGLFDTGPLEKMIKGNLNPLALKVSGVRLLVGAVCLETGEYRYVEGTDYEIAEWVLASSAFPVAFPPRIISGNHWVDGGVRDITPITDVLDMEPDVVDVIMSGPLGQPVPGFPSKDAGNVLKVALRTGNLMADEVFNSDLDRVPESKRSRLVIYDPPKEAKLPDPLDFNKQSIAEMYQLGLWVGSENR